MSQGNHDAAAHSGRRRFSASGDRAHMSLREVDGVAGAALERELAGKPGQAGGGVGAAGGQPSRRSGAAASVRLSPARCVRRPGRGASRPSTSSRASPVSSTAGWRGRRSSCRSRSGSTSTGLRYDVPDAIVVMVDCWTSPRWVAVPQLVVDGSVQGLPLRRGRGVRRLALPDDRTASARGLTGKSSGGYGAMVVPMMRPDVWGALASHAGDALCEARCCPTSGDRAGSARQLRRVEERFFEVLAEQPRFDWGVRQAVRDVRLRGRVLAGPRPAGRGAHAVRARHRAATRRSGSGGSSSTRCGWRRATRTRCGR